MNFFDAQDQARRSTRRLVFAYVIATALIVAGTTAIVAYAAHTTLAGTSQLSFAAFAAQNPTLIGGTAIFAALLILGASLYKTSILSSGGGRVAADMGGTQVSSNVQDPLRQRLRNVVEEMAIASGVPVPEIYVLEEEGSINAFAAGYAPGDAAVAVTRGTLELLNREELQGVIAHEFSHILNGDMRLNIRLMGVLFGIMVLGLMGRVILRGGHRTSFSSSRRGNGTAMIMIIGIGLAVLGGIGVLAARIIKSSVSRQREYLADASAVQFTRQTEGISNALKKIGGYKESSYITSTDPEEVSHMLFGAGSKLSGMFSTHPPLGDRIRALDPSFSESDYPHVSELRDQAISAEGAGEHRAAGFSGAAAGSALPLPDAIEDSVGHPDTKHVEFARRLRATIPEILYDAAHSGELAYLLTIALVLDQSGKSLPSQYRIAEERLGAQRTSLIRNYYEALAGVGPEFRLPILEIAFPALKLRPAEHLTFLLDLVARMIEVDGRVDLHEYCLYRMLRYSLGQAADPGRQSKRRRAPRKEVRNAAINLLSIIADYGHERRDEKELAFRAGISALPDWANTRKFETDPKYSLRVLDHSLDLLQALNGGGRMMLLKAISAVVVHDGKVTTSEAELLRAICATLDCPLPPILDISSTS